MKRIYERTDLTTDYVSQIFLLRFKTFGSEINIKYSNFSTCIKIRIIIFKFELVFEFLFFLNFNDISLMVATNLYHFCGKKRGDPFLPCCKMSNCECFTH